mgnify:CR=1 FL=1
MSDFGIARISEVVSGRRPSGTPGYMAPEQALGSISERSDVFVLGVVLYECLTGCNPLLEGLRELPEDPRIPSELLELLRRATAYDPVNRPSMGELRAELELMLATLMEA